MTTTVASILLYPLVWISSMSLTTSLLVLLTVSALTYYWYMNSSHDDWTRYGVKAPKLPWFFFYGSDFRAMFSQLLQQYGDIIGLYNRGRLMLLTTNLDLLRHILIKDFNNFVDRSDGFQSNSPFARSLFFAKGSEWRRHRQIVSPTFSSGKLKHISKMVDKTAQDLTDYLETFAKSGKLVPIKELSGQYTCEIVAKTAFGLEAKCIGQDTEFFEFARTMLRVNPRTGIWRILPLILVTIPHLSKFCIKVLKTQYFDPIDSKADKYFNVIISNTIAERKQHQRSGVKGTRVDFLDLLLKANDEVAAGTLKATEEEFKNSEWSQDGKTVQSLSQEEIIGHSMLIIFAGMETTATTFQMCLYELALNQDIQEKIFQEIKSVVKSDTPTPEEINSLSYTEQVLNETLRLFPPVPNVNRVAKETRTYNGITIPKGSVVTIPYFYILKDPKIFPEPQKFDPNRFSPEEKEKRDPLSFIAFGHGPRLCLGMRLAYLELKVGLVHVLRRLKVVLNEHTEPKIGTQQDEMKFLMTGLLAPAKPIMLAFEVR